MAKRNRPPRVPNKNSENEEIRRLREELHRMKEDRDRQVIDFLKFREATHETLLAIGEMTAKSKAVQEAISKSLDRKHAGISCSELDRRLKRQDTNIHQLQQELVEAEEEIKRRDTTIDQLRQDLVEAEIVRRKMHNTMMELKGNIRVFCRVRPFLTGDALGNEGIISYPSTMETRDQGLEIVTGRGGRQPFTFDRVFRPETSQKDVFVEISELVRSALDGHKVCIFSYGQTGAGKTYTMLGERDSPERRGLIPRSLEQISEAVLTPSAQGWEYTLKVSMFEIYNNEVYDLLSRRSSAKRVMVGQNAKVVGLTDVCVDSVDRIEGLLDVAAKGRSVRETLMNTLSSRSHFICKLLISRKNKDTKEAVEGVLNLVDLAGSQRGSTSNAAGAKEKEEARQINSSLSFLSTCIHGIATKESHVTFGNCVLTRVLQPYLGGDSKTLMFVNVSPEPSSAEESLSSLRFAAGVSQCRIGEDRFRTAKRARDPQLSHGGPASSRSRLGYGLQTPKWRG